MPNYSPARKVFSSTNRDIKELPFEEVRSLYNEVEATLLDDAQADIDEEYEQERLAWEQDYSDTHEAPFEGCYSDSHPKRKALNSPELLSKKATEAIKTGFIDKYGIQLHTDWVMPQIITLLGNMRVTKNSNGLISGTRFKLDNFTTNWLKGIYRFIMINTKSTYLKLQYKAPAKQYGALVPIILYAQRLVNGTPYSAWDPEELHDVVHSDLADAMVYEPPKYTKEELLSIRTEGLKHKSGANIGTLKNPVSTHALSGVTNTTFKGMPPLVQVMLTQIWMAHPDNRTKYMVLDPKSWDRMPPSLVDRDVLVAPVGLNHRSLGSGKLVAGEQW